MAIIGQWLRQTLGRDCPIVEICLVGCIESIEDRVPNNEEIALFLRCHPKQDPEGVLYTWKEKEIVRVEFDDNGPKVFTLVNPFENIPD